MSFVAEERLLIECSRVTLDEEAIKRAIDLLQQPLDWDYVVETSIRHGVSPLFYHGVQQLMPHTAVVNRIPARHLVELHILHQGNLARNQRLYGVIKDIFEHFQQAGVTAMALKDIQLAQEVYSDLSLRTMGDIDILIQKTDYAKAAACLSKLGFAPLPGEDIPYTLKYAWSQHFRRLEDDVWVDLQWNILQLEWDCYAEGNFNFEIERMWRDATQMEIEGCTILVPRPEDMLFHLCLHLEGHAYAELILFCDIVELLRHEGERLDWGYFVEVTKRYRVESSVYYVFYLLECLFHVCLSAWVLSALAPTYFQAALFKPVYGNLTALHQSLDEIRVSSPRSHGLMDKLETLVRRQAVSAMHLFKKIDKLIHAFIDQGGALLVANGEESEQIFPDLALQPFGKIQLAILKQDLPRFEQVMVRGHFVRRNDHNGQSNVYETCWQFASMDPVVKPSLTNMQMTIRLEEDLQKLLENCQARRGTRKQIALRLLKARIKGGVRAATHIPVQVQLVALSLDEMAVFLSAQAGKETQARLFALCNLVEFFRRFLKSLDLQRVLALADQGGVLENVKNGLSMAECILNNLLDLSTVSVMSEISPIHMLEWARYGENDLVYHTHAKHAFYYLLGLLHMERTSEKGRYLLRSLTGSNGQSPILFTLGHELIQNAKALAKPKVNSARDFAYWVEPSIRSALEATR